MSYTPQGVPTQGIGFAIPGKTVRDRVADLRKIAADPKAAKEAEDAKSRVRKLFGLTLQDLTPKLAETLGFNPGSGVLIADISPKSPAERAQLKQGLVIVQIGRYEINSVQQVEELMKTVESGAPVDFTISVVRQLNGRNFRQSETVQLIAK